MTHSADPLDAHMDAMAVTLGLRVDPAWRAAVRANLDVTLRMARVVDEFALPDEAEPAPVYIA